MNCVFFQSSKIYNKSNLQRYTLASPYTVFYLIDNCTRDSMNYSCVKASVFTY